MDIQGQGGAGVVGAPDFRKADSILAAYAPGLLARVAEADTLDGLVAAASGHGGLVRILVQMGLPVMAVAKAVALLNERVMERLYHLTLPAGIAADACLIVMGSEGRAEQILKTDQDNGLILRDGVDPAGLADHLARFSDGLSRLGWPPCKGHVMVDNPFWVQTESAWRERVRQWIRLPRDEDYMHLAIFADAAAVGGDTTLLSGVKTAMLEEVGGHAHFLSKFAHVAVTFGTPLGIFGVLLTDHGRVDVKKGGIFPLVHGVRAFALQHGIAATNTLDRLAALAAAGRLDKGLAIDLREAFEFLVGLRVKAKLLDAVQDGADNLVAVAHLAPDERDDLRMAFKAVNRFKDLLTYHFHLSMF